MLLRNPLATRFFCFRCIRYRSEISGCFLIQDRYADAWAGRVIPKYFGFRPPDKYFCMNIGLYGAVRMKDGKLLSFDMSIRGSYIKHVLSHSATRFHHCFRD